MPHGFGGFGGADPGSEPALGVAPRAQLGDLAGEQPGLGGDDEEVLDRGVGGE